MRLRTISRNSWLVGTGWMSFQVVFITAVLWHDRGAGLYESLVEKCFSPRGSCGQFFAGRRAESFPQDTDFKDDLGSDIATEYSRLS